MEDKKSKYEGVPCDEKSMKEYNKTWKDMEESFKYVEVLDAEIQRR